MHCKNDASRRYTGDEPSPKGLGWCAHAERVGSTREGKDGAVWVVRKVSGRVGDQKRWVKGKEEKEENEEKEEREAEYDAKQLRHLEATWRFMSSGGIVVVRKKGMRKGMEKLSGKSKEEISSLDADPSVLALVWSPISVDAWQMRLGKKAKRCLARSAASSGSLKGMSGKRLTEEVFSNYSRFFTRSSLPFLGIERKGWMP